MDLRTEVGRVSRAGFPRRGRDPDPEPRRKIAQPLFSRARSSRSRLQLPARCVLDGEIVVAKDGGLDFDALQLRIHPAASRVKLLVARRSRPRSCSSICSAKAIAICAPSRSESRRKKLESLLSSADAAHPPHAGDHESSIAADWFRRFEGAGLDGVMAKPSRAPTSRTSA